MGWNVIQSISSPTSDKLNFSGLDLSAYNRYRLILSNLEVGTDDADITMQLGFGGTLVATGYQWELRTYTVGGSADQENETTDSTSIYLIGGASNRGIGNATDECGAVVADLFNMHNARDKLVRTHTAFYGPTTVMHGQGSGMLSNTGNVNRIEIGVSTGTLPSGSGTLYGLSIS